MIVKIERAAVGRVTVQRIASGPRSDRFPDNPGPYLDLVEISQGSDSMEIRIKSQYRAGLRSRLSEEMFIWARPTTRKSLFNLVHPQVLLAPRQHETLDWKWVERRPLVFVDGDTNLLWGKAQEYSEKCYRSDAYSHTPIGHRIGHFVAHSDDAADELGVLLKLYGRANS